MIILDTNVISEVLRHKPSHNVVTWMRAQRYSDLFTTTITLAEMLYGVEVSPAGKRRDALARSLQRIIDETLAGHILSFDEDAARSFALLSAERQRLGRPIAKLDAQIAAVARCRGGAVATRNTRDFVDCGVKVIDPWAYSN